MVEYYKVLEEEGYLQDEGSHARRLIDGCDNGNTGERPFGDHQQHA